MKVLRGRKRGGEHSQVRLIQRKVIQIIQANLRKIVEKDMLKKEANIIVGGLSAPGKMPCPSINLPAVACVTGAKLAQVPGTTCHGCYALKGRYNFKYTKIAMARRLAALAHESWTAAMVTLMSGFKHFRWHDSGDLQGAQHLKNILEVAGVPLLAYCDCFQCFKSIIIIIITFNITIHS